VSIAFDGTISVPGSNFIASNNPFPFNGYVWPAALASPALPFPGVNGQVLTVLDNSVGTIGWTNAGTLQSVVAGAGLTVTSTPTTATVSLTTVSSITPGSFGATAIIPTFSVNAQGQITSTGSANPYPPFQIATVSAPPFLVLDFTDNNTNWEYTLNGNLTLSNPINVQPGMRGGMLLRQDPFSPFALSWGTSWKFANNTPATISPVASAVDYFEFVVVASNYIIVTLYLPGIG
jgi:surface antigen